MEAGKAGRSRKQRGVRDKNHLQRPREEVIFSPQAALARGLWSSFYAAAFLTSIVASGFLPIGACCVLAEAMDRNLAMPDILGRLKETLGMVALLFATAWLFFGLITLVGSFFLGDFSRRRTIRALREHIVYHTRFRTVYLPLEECTWRLVPRSFVENSHWPLSPVLYVVSNRQWIFCGYDDESRERWLTYFKAAGVKQSLSQGAGSWIKWVSLGAIVGGIAGGAIGYAMAIPTGTAHWLPTGVLLGIYDGAALATYYLLLDGSPTGRARREGLKLLGIAMFFAGLGNAIGRIFEVEYVLCSILNAIIVTAGTKVIMNVVSKRRRQDGPSGANRDSDELYVVKDGPLKGGFVTILSDSEDGKEIRAIVSGSNWLTPPITLNRSELQPIRWRLGLFPWWAQASAVGLAVSATAFAVTRWNAALVAASACFAGCVTHYLMLVFQKRRRSKCPLCGKELDLETRSHCTACGWDRPMPTFVDRSFVGQQQ